MKPKGPLHVARVTRALQVMTRETVGGPAPGERSAGVAILLAGPPEAPSMCFIQRVERPGDRWSGDVAFPGGWSNAGDGGLRFTAMRETHEEVGVELNETHHIACLPTSRISPGRSTDLGVIGASVFYVGRDLPALQPDPRELSDAFWVPGEHLVDQRNAATIDWAGADMPGIEFDSRIIWGLTYRILGEFLDVVGAA